MQKAGDRSFYRTHSCAWTAINPVPKAVMVRVRGLLPLFFFNFYVFSEHKQLLCHKLLLQPPAPWATDCCIILYSNHVC